MHGLRIPPRIGIHGANGTIRACDAGVVHEQRRWAEVLLRHADDALDVAPVRHIAGNGEGLAARRLDLGDRRIELRGRARGDRDQSSRGGEALGDRLAETATGTGDERDLTFELTAHTATSATT